MVSVEEVSRVIEDLARLKGRYTETIDSLNSYWKGPSFENLYSSIEDFKDEYIETINSQLEEFKQAIEIYSNYQEADKMISVAEDNLSLAMTSGDAKGISDANSDKSKLENDKTNFKNSIETCLRNASSPRLEASPLNIELNSPIASTSSSGTGTSTTGSGETQMNAATKTNDAYTGTLDMDNYPTGDSFEDGLDRATLVAKYLMENGDFTAEQAAALAGTYLDENNCKPNDYMEAEAAGLGVAGTGGDGYGAGIASWTFSDSKNQALADAGYSAGTPIESLSLKEQCDMIIAQSQKSDKYYFDALKRCDTIEDASATAVVYMGGIGYSNSWDTHPTTDDAKRVSNSYGASNDARFGSSAYHWNLDERRLDYAKTIYERLQGE